ncbi:hypothetical protein M422DRAFT_234542 [Sphaerobolus stellatus SS14]|uniref:Uncharacterized protein n=1 Tax=Sphaerobolus stellatus (strain SS14) TaxID=990650 RepID=A0A0C9UQU0_SPHS4|nr:hypothetical protein M422DRAFT_234542 [Sphaerobolus stellatus SS14]
MPVTGIIIGCEGDRGSYTLFQPVEIDEKHPIHRLGVHAPLSNIIGLLFKVYRHVPRSRVSGVSGAGLDNQIATYLMIEKDGFAGPEWQVQAGTVTVMREDGKPLTPESIETIWMYFDWLLELFGDDPSYAQNQMTREKFEAFCKRYKDERLLNGFKQFEKLELPS